MFQGSQSHKMSEWLSRGLHHLPQITSLWKNQFYSLLNFKHLPLQSSGITLLRAKPETDDSKDLLLGLWNICCKNLKRTYKSLQKTLSKENMYQHLNIIWQKVSRLICWVSNNLLSWHSRKLNSSQSNATEPESVIKRHPLHAVLETPTCLVSAHAGRVLQSWSHENKALKTH